MGKKKVFIATVAVFKQESIKWRKTLFYLNSDVKGLGVLVLSAFCATEPVFFLIGLAFCTENNKG